MFQCYCHRYETKAENLSISMMFLNWYVLGLGQVSDVYYGSGHRGGSELCHRAESSLPDPEHACDDGVDQRGQSRNVTLVNVAYY